MKYQNPPGRDHPVGEGDCCPKWEPCNRNCMVMMQECWFCRWSEFDSESVKHQTESRCNYS